RIGRRSLGATPPNTPSASLPSGTTRANAALAALLSNAQRFSFSFTLVFRRDTMRASKEEMQLEALSRAASGQSLTNLPAIFHGFMAKGIPEADIRPRENVHLSRLAGAWPPSPPRRARREGHHVCPGRRQDGRRRADGRRERRTGQEEHYEGGAGGLQV